MVSTSYFSLTFCCNFLIYFSDLCGFPVILRFCDGFHTVLLNGRPFPTNFGGAPMPVTVPGGRKHYLRFSGLTENTQRAMHQFIRIREQKGGLGREGLGDGPILPGDASSFGGKLLHVYYYLLLCRIE